MKPMKRFYNGFHFSREGGPDLNPPPPLTILSCVSSFFGSCIVSRNFVKGNSRDHNYFEYDRQQHGSKGECYQFVDQPKWISWTCNKALQRGICCCQHIFLFQLKRYALWNVVIRCASILHVADMSWHGLLTQSPDGLYRITNQVVGNAHGWLFFILEAMHQLTRKVL